MSGSEPQLGFPPGPPFALTIGRLSGKRYESSPASSAASMITDLPLPPNASRPPFSRNHCAPRNRQAYVGEYLFNSSVVGTTVLSARTMLGWFPPMVLIPDCENPTAESSS